MSNIIQKDKEGERLIRRLTVPHTPTKKEPVMRITPADSPDEFERFYQYNLTDVQAEASIGALIPGLEGEELEYWFCDFEMNARGVAVDREMIDHCAAIVDQVLAKYDAKLATVTGGAVEKCSQIERLKQWCATRGVLSASYDADSIAALLKIDTAPAEVREALVLRQAAGSASVKKVFAMREQMCADGRLRGLFLYHAARTGRITGAGPQPTNLPKEGPPSCKCAACGKYHGLALTHCPWCGMPEPPDREPDDWTIEAAESVIELLPARSMELLEYYFGSAMDAIAGCLRALFVAGPGKEFISSDYNSIEAVVAAALANEEWRLEVFRTHGKIYEMGASKISGVPFQEFLDYRKRTGKHHPLRQGIGKVSELASGYQGWIGSWKAFGADKFMNDEEIKQGVLAWRAASPAIVHLWGALQDAAINAVQSPGTVYPAMRLDGQPSGIRYQMRGDALFCRLPSGRELTYHRPRLEMEERRGRMQWSLSYEGWNSNPLNGPTGWIRMRTWGGKLFENCCQAVARDFLRRAIILLEKHGYPVVAQVYDEVVCELPAGAGTLAELESLMNTTLEWAVGWPVRASGGWIGQRYRKG